MRTRRNVVLGVFLLGALSACQPAAAVLSEKDVSDIKGTVDRWVNDFLTNKRDDVANIITADMVLLPPNTAAIVGHDGALAYLKAYPPITKFTVTKDEVVGQSDLAYVRGTYSIDVTLPDKNAAHEQGTYLEVHRKQKDGTWPYSRLIWHSSEPLPAPAPTPAKK
jgi:ketosteroid isomerase-like protein